MAGHFQTTASPIHVSIALSILRTPVSDLDIETKQLESRGRWTMQNRHFWPISAIFRSIYVDEENNIMILSSFIYVLSCMISLFPKIDG